MDDTSRFQWVLCPGVRSLCVSHWFCWKLKLAQCHLGQLVALFSLNWFVMIILTVSQICLCFIIWRYRSELPLNFPCSFKDWVSNCAGPHSNLEMNSSHSFPGRVTSLEEEDRKTYRKLGSRKMVAMKVICRGLWEHECVSFDRMRAGHERWW